MVNSLSEWFYSHRLITRQQARKSTMRICFILAKQANRKAFIFFFSQQRESCSECHLWTNMFHLEILMPRIFLKLIFWLKWQTNIFITKRYFPSQLFAHLGGLISLIPCSPPSPDGVFRTRQFRNKQGRKAVLPFLCMTQLIARTLSYDGLDPAWTQVLWPGGSGKAFAHLPSLKPEIICGHFSPPCWLH